MPNRNIVVGSCEAATKSWNFNVSMRAWIYGILVTIFYMMDVIGLSIVGAAANNVNYYYLNPWSWLGELSLWVTGLMVIILWVLSISAIGGWCNDNKIK